MAYLRAGSRNMRTGASQLFQLAVIRRHKSDAGTELVLLALANEPSVSSSQMRSGFNLDRDRVSRFSTLTLGTMRSFRPLSANMEILHLSFARAEDITLTIAIPAKGGTFVPILPSQ